jgi:hypothetical protein
MPVKVRTIEGHDWLPVGLAASELSYSPATVRRLCKAGQLVCVTENHTGYRWISRQSIDAVKMQYAALTATPALATVGSDSD